MFFTCSIPARTQRRRAVPSGLSASEMASLAGAAITLQIRAAGLGVGPAKSAARNLTARGEGPGLTFLPTFTRNNGSGSSRQRKTRRGHAVTMASAGGDKVTSASAAAAGAFGGDLPADKVKQLQSKTLGMMFASYMSIYFVRKPFSVVKAPMQDALGMSTASIAGIDSAFLGLYAIGQLTLPALGDRLGARKMLVVGYLISAVACLLFGVTSNPMLLALAWGINGLAQSVAYPLHVKILNPWFRPTERGTAMGLWATSQQVGGVLSTALAAFLLGVAGWRFAIFAPAAFVVVSAAMLMFVPVDPPWCKTEKAKGNDGEDLVVGECDAKPPPGMLEVLRIPKLGMLMASYFFVKIVRYCLIFWLPFYLARECGMAVGVAGYMSCIFDLGGVAGGIATGIVCDKYFAGRRTILGAGMCVALTVAILCYQRASGMGMVTNGAVMGIIGLLVAGPDALLGSSSISDTCEAAGYGSEVMGTASGLVNGAGSVGAVLQGALTAFIADRYGWGALFNTLAAMSAIAVVTLLAAVPDTAANAGEPSPPNAGAGAAIATA